MFWQPENVAGHNNLLVSPAPKKNKEKPDDQKTATDPKLEVKSILKASMKKHTSPLRVVHLDLKGAAPKVSYFQQVREHL